MCQIQQQIAIQATYDEKYQYCWGCGPKNEAGLHLQSYPSETGTVCHFQPEAYQTGGVPDKLFGGMIAVLFDCHGTASAAWFAHQALGFDLTPTTRIERFITARLEIDYKQPTPMAKPLTVTAQLESLTERKAIVTMTLLSAGQVCAEARMVAVRAKSD